MRRPRRIAMLLAALLAVPAAAGAADRPGVVFIAGGIGGLDPLQTWGPLALSWAGVPHEVRVFEWTHGKFHMLRDLQDTRYLEGKAAELADEVRTVKADDPSRPVFLVGHSAGAAVVLGAAGRLPPGTLERVVVLSAAVSPDYDLRPALRATRGEVVAFHSPLDVFMLHFGTGTFGTVDRYYEDAAGLEGFRVPDGIDEEGRRQYDRLVQSGWEPEMCLQRRCWHNSTCMPVFLSCEVAPWLTRPVEGGSR